MVKAKFSDLMLEKFKKLKMSRLLCYLTDGTDDGKVSYCKIGIETNKGCLDLYNEETSVDWFEIDGEKTKEDISIFSCKDRGKNESFAPYIKDMGIIRHYVSEDICSIKIVSDLITVNNGEYCIDYDIAVIIKTTAHEYFFSRGWLFGEEIYVHIDEDIDHVFSIDDEVKNWNNDGDFAVNVQRTIKEL